MNDDLTIYTKPGCPWCLAVTGHLRNEGYDFDEVDVLSSDAALEEMKDLSGQTLAPTVRWRDTVMGDCSLRDLKRLLRDRDIRP